MKIRIACSPDSDDAFMFWALLHGEIDSEGLEFVAETRDTEALNALAAETDSAEAVDVLAVSAARYATIADQWLLLPHGASVGRGYGPVVVAAGKDPLSLESLAGKRIGVPGLRTTAYLVLRILLADFDPVVIPIAPFAEVWRALREGEVDAALVIHEGRLTFEREGFGFVCDIGASFRARFDLPIPLGVNVTRRGLGEARIAQVSRLCRQSIAWALDHRNELIDRLLPLTPLDRNGLDRYLSMYANEDTRAMTPDVIVALDTLFREAAERNLIPGAPIIEMAP